jgi:Fe-S-cluster containining protein
MRRGANLAYISATLKGAAQMMDDESRHAALDCFEHWRSECERLTPEDPKNVAHTVHAIIDERVQHMLATSKHGPEVTCTKGCAACCHLQVDINPREAELLRAVAAEAGIEIDEARLARQATKNPDTWRELAPEDRRCVFLAEDRTCRVHEHRPGACRKYHVLSDPDLCDMEKHPGGKVGIVFDVEAEIIHSAAMTVYGAGSMAAMLLRAR